MEEEVVDMGYGRSRAGSLDHLYLDKQETKSSGEGSTYVLKGEGEGAVTCTVSVNGDYLKVTGALHEVVTDALKELAHVTPKHLDGKGKLDSEYTMVTRLGRRTNKLRRWIEQKDKQDRGVKPKAPDVSRAFEVIILAKAAHEASNVSYALWPVSAKQRRLNLINGPAPKRQKVEEEVDYGNHNNNNNLYESGAVHLKEIKKLKASHGNAIVQLQRSQEEALQHIREENGKRVDELVIENQSLADEVYELQEALLADLENQI